MIKEPDHQGGWVMHPTALPAFLEMYCNLHVATKPMRILVCESEINYYYYYYIFQDLRTEETQVISLTIVFLEVFRSSERLNGKYEIMFHF